MSRKKKVSSYYQKQEDAKKKAAAKKRNRRIEIIVASILVVALLVSILMLWLSNRPVKVAIEVKDYGTITLELYPDIAPITVKNFVNYVKDGFYDGLTFHRIIEGFMIQGGDPTGTGYGDSSLETIKGEFWANGVENDLAFDRGVIGMARSNDYDSASTQFFICHQKQDVLDGNYAAFGKVIDGMDVVDAIATCDKTDETDAQGYHYVPSEKVIIQKAYVVGFSFFF